MQSTAIISNALNCVFFSLDREKPLSLYIFSKNEADVSLILENTSSGNVCVNDSILQVLGNEIIFSQNI